MSDIRHMQRAITLAKRGLGYVEPNPMVGCVIVSNHKVVGEGWHRRFGGPHAEVEALKAAGAAARGADVYVTLEPCCHHGKTPPCVDALIAAKIKQVYVACVDSFEQVAGQGIKSLEAAGIKVHVGMCRAQATALNEPFFKRVLTGMPYVIAKWAQTVDGAIATRGGDSKWISNQKSRRMVHQLRARVDAIIVGVGTAKADDPLLTARDVKVRRTARRIVIDPTLRLPLSSQLVRSAREIPLMLATSTKTTRLRADRQKKLEAAGVEVVTLPGYGRRGRLNLQRLLSILAKEHDATNVLVEGGAVVTGTLIDQDLADELMVFIGPRVLGDAAARCSVDAGRAIGRMAAARPVTLQSVKRLGGDVLMRYRLG
ncbi:bifunctional diaminohydroxyphosphoribosylaminopyrimidine deaminase/5-amino-6-(5-phosphoribosylamino)uracil reductase RibD [Planctomycetales bacterium ZRK34]|nr:bifunctional diaminohydroxyphosphoribosylaminopyrimidine deaminase/5-amino-6-(5-phosphoribosylamino)uracil reductase RibD [Planctomycetales bacterium ZRK34]